MNNLHMIGWDVNNEPHLLEAVSTKDAAFFEHKLSGKVTDWVILSTCHRVEIYSSDPIPEFKDLSPYHSFSGEEALMHLFRVSSGIESVSVGEQEILHQVKIAYEEALAHERCSKTLSLIFQKAIGVGKLVREKVPISKGKTSVPAHVGQMLSAELDARGQRIAIVGSGKLASDLVKYALMARPASLRVYARSEESLERIARSYSIETHSKIDPDEIIRDNDIIIAATSSKKPIFDGTISAKGKLLIDLGMPPNASRSISGCRLISLSDIEPIMRSNSTKKKALIPKVEEIINAELDRFIRKLGQLEADDLIKTVFEHSKNLEQNEVKVAMDLIRKGMDIEKVIAQMADSLVNKVLAPQTLAIKKMVKVNQNRETIEVLQEFYRLLKGTQEKASRRSSSGRQASQDPPAQIPQ
jgi:glutamyl-tRNA reductase